MWANRETAGLRDLRCTFRITAADRIAVCSLEEELPGGRN